MFGTSKEANEFVAFAKSKGYDVSKPIKEKRAQSAKKAYDLNGKPVKYQWKVVMGARGVGKKGGKKEDDSSCAPEYRYIRKSREHSGNGHDILTEGKEQKVIKEKAGYEYSTKKGSEN